MNERAAAMLNTGVIINNCQLCAGKGLLPITQEGAIVGVEDCHECHGQATFDKPDPALNGTLGYRYTTNGLLITIQPLLWDVLRLTIGSASDTSGYEKCYDYEARFHDMAFLSLREWDGNDDPIDGWHRSFPPYYRRREDGNPSAEVVRP